MNSNFIKMRYKDFEFPQNPTQIKITRTKNINESPLFDVGSAVEEVSRNAAQITVSGKILGEESFALLSRLQMLQEQRGAGTLFLPGGEYFDAYFEKLETVRNASLNLVEYTAVFRENESHRKPEIDFGFTYAQAGENAFDIANRCSVTVESIMQANDFMSPFDITEGSRVVLK